MNKKQELAIHEMRRKVSELLWMTPTIKSRVLDAVKECIDELEEAHSLEIAHQRHCLEYPNWEDRKEI